MAAKKTIPVDQNIIDYPMEEAMPDNYLPYAVEVAKDRALPDVRDGLKPVHRRILYGAYLLKATPDKPYYKSARIVGDIMGKFHPHGDSSVYDAMTILAQSFSTREPLIEGQGNWGSIDGDSAAAMRYTEARLSPMAMELLRDIEMGTVDFQPNYADIEMEPTILPARFPNLLVNGSFGIAVGLSTNIPPHNLGEVIDGTCALIDKPGATTLELMEHIKGPDLPTGGYVIGREALIAAYETGEGKAVLRAKCRVEKLENGRYAIVISEFPYRKNKARIVQTISDLTGDKRHQKALEAIAEIRDESGRGGIRAVVEMRRNTSEEHAEKILKYLLKKTDLQSNLSFNMVAIDGGKPKTFGLKGMLSAYVAHQKEVVTRRTQRELETAEKRYHIVQGFMKAIDVMDELLKTIRASKNKADANKNIREQFGFTEVQATAILELMLYRLTGLEMNAFIKESAELEALIGKLRGILNDEKTLLKLIKKELQEIKKKFANPRRTVIIDDEELAEITHDELIVVEDSMVTLSREGFMKKIPVKSYTRSTTDTEAIELREGDAIACVFKTNTFDEVLIFTNLGNMYKLKSQKIPEMKWKDKGVRFDELQRVSLAEEEQVVSAFSLKAITASMVFKFITDQGGIKRTLGENFDTKYSKLAALKLAEGERLYGVIIEEGLKLSDNRVISLLPVNDGAYKLSGPDSEILSEIPDGDDIVEAVSQEDATEQEFLTLPMFMRIETEKGLAFTVPEGECEVRDKMIVPGRFAEIPGRDRISKVTYEYDFAGKTFSLEIDETGVVKPAGPRRKSSPRSIDGNSNDVIIVILSSGIAHKIPGYIFEDLKGTVKLSELYAFDPKREKVILALATDGSNPEAALVLATTDGFIKKLSVESLLNSGSSFMVTKFKKAEEALIFGDTLSAAGEDKILLITARGMAIKFSAKHLSVLGRSAAGVSAIALKEDDYLVFGAIAEGIKTLSLKTNANGKAEVDIDSIKLQNRAGKGVNIFKVVLNEFIAEVSVK